MLWMCILVQTFHINCFSQAVESIHQDTEILPYRFLLFFFFSVSDRVEILCSKSLWSVLFQLICLFFSLRVKRCFNFDFFCSSWYAYLFKSSDLVVTNFFSMVSFHYAVFFRTATSFHSIFKCVLSLIQKINISKIKKRICLYTPEIHLRVPTEKIAAQIRGWLWNG